MNRINANVSSACLYKHTHAYDLLFGRDLSSILQHLLCFVWSWKKPGKAGWSGCIFNWHTADNFWYEDQHNECDRSAVRVTALTKRINHMLSLITTTSTAIIFINNPMVYGRSWHVKTFNLLNWNYIFTLCYQIQGNLYSMLMLIVWKFLRRLYFIHQPNMTYHNLFRKNRTIKTMKLEAGMNRKQQD